MQSKTAVEHSCIDAGLLSGAHPSGRFRGPRVRTTRALINSASTVSQTAVTSAALSNTFLQHNTCTTCPQGTIRPPACCSAGIHQATRRSLYNGTSPSKKEGCFFSLSLTHSLSPPLPYTPPTSSASSHTVPTSLLATSASSSFPCLSFSPTQSVHWTVCPPKKKNPRD